MEGAAIIAAFQHQAQEISAAKAVAQPVKSPGEGWTLDKLTLLDNMYNDLSELRKIPSRLSFMEDRLTAAGQDLASTNITGVYYEIELMKAQLHEIVEQGSAGTAGVQCSPCGGMHQGSSGGGQVPCSLTPAGGAGSSSDGEPWHVGVLRAVIRGNGT